MKNKDLILMLIDKSVNAFGDLIGLTGDAKLKVALTIIQDTIKSSWDIDSVQLTPKSLSNVLLKEQLNIDQTSLLSNLLWAQAELLLKLNQPIESMKNYENTLLLFQWQIYQNNEKNHLEKQNKITELKAVIEQLELTRNQLNYN